MTWFILSVDEQISCILDICRTEEGKASVKVFYDVSTHINDTELWIMDKNHVKDVLWPAYSLIAEHVRLFFWQLFSTLCALIW